MQINRRVPRVEANKEPKGPVSAREKPSSARVTFVTTRMKLGSACMEPFCACVMVFCADVTHVMRYGSSSRPDMNDVCARETRLRRAVRSFTHAAAGPTHAPKRLTPAVLRSDHPLANLGRSETSVATGEKASPHLLGVFVSGARAVVASVVALVTDARETSKSKRGASRLRPPASARARRADL